jgi:hypothetical protein
VDLLGRFDKDISHGERSVVDSRFFFEDGFEELEDVQAEETASALLEDHPVSVTGHGLVVFRREPVLPLFGMT